MCCRNKKLFVLGLAGLVFLAGTLWYGGGFESIAEEVPSLTSEALLEPADEEKHEVSQRKLRHVVLFQFKETSSEQEVQAVVDAFKKLPKQIPEIAEFEFGTNNSPEGLEDGLTHCFLVTFGSEKDREVYLPHPAHQAFVEVLRPHLQKVVVFDYWTDK